MVLHASTPKQVFPPQTCSRFAAVRFPQSRMKLDDRVARKQVGGREQIEGKKSEVTEDE